MSYSETFEEQKGHPALGGYLAYLLPVMLGLLLVNACATLPENVQRSVSYAYDDTDHTYLAKAREVERKAHPDQSGFYLLGDGLDAFVARAQLAQYAEVSIDVQYYLYHDDLVGRLFTDQLLKAADRGVRVRLLVDDMDLLDREDAAAKLDSHPNVEVRIFNPFSRDTGRAGQFVTRFDSVTRRMHNKSFTVDNQATILGGRNIGDEYFEADEELNFADLDVLAIGPVAKEVSQSFDIYWNSELAYPASALSDRRVTPQELEASRQRLNEFVAQQTDSKYFRALRNSDLANAIRKDQVTYQWGETEVVYDQPEKILHDKSQTAYHLSPKLEPYLKGIEKELTIFSPYFVPGESGVAFFRELSEQGVRVRILTNSLASTDVAIVHSGYAKYRKDLLRAGIELYEMNKNFTEIDNKSKSGEKGSAKESLHAKSFVFDRRQIFIGSLNLDPMAVRNNTEIGVVITQQGVAQYVAESFDRHIDRIAFRLELKTDESGHEQILWHGFENGEEVTFTKEPHTSLWQRCGSRFMGLWPIESFL